RLILLSLFFVLYCYVLHRDLHPFPTRRSSDLVGDYVRGTLLDLFLAFDGARSGHDDDLLAADACTVYVDDGVLLLPGPAGKFVGLRDAVDLGDAVQDFDVPRVELRLDANGAQHRLIDAARPVHVKSVAIQSFDDLLDLTLLSTGLHYYDHRGNLVERKKRYVVLL